MILEIEKRMLGLIMNSLLSKGFPTILTQGMQEVLYHLINQLHLDVVFLETLEDYVYLQIVQLVVQ